MAKKTLEHTLKPNPTPKKLTRRDAIKILGAAAGASVLANLPSQWSTPEIASGVLPAHAQTSFLGLEILSCSLNLNIVTGVWSSSPLVGPLSNISNPGMSIPMKFTITFVNTHAVAGSDPQSPNPFINSHNLNTSTGTVDYVTSSFGPLTTPGPLAPDSGATSGSITVLWEFASPLHGTGSCSQTANWILV